MSNQSKWFPNLGKFGIFSLLIFRCEGARLCLNKNCNFYNLKLAKKYMENAIYFTPQYGDSFIEAINLAILTSDFEFLESTKNKAIVC